MKKFLTGILCCICILGMTGCGSNSKAQITVRNGDKVEMTAKELLDIRRNNGPKYDNHYEYAAITLTGTISKISSFDDKTFNNGYRDDIYIITLKEGWEVWIKQAGNQSFIADLDSGNRIKVNSYLTSNTSSDNLVLFGIKECDTSSYCYDLENTTISVID